MREVRNTLFRGREMGEGGKNYFVRRFPDFTHSFC
jgi:hypothetical protein